MKKVAIKHPTLGLEGQCLPESLPGWLRQGWVLADEAEAPSVEEIEVETPVEEFTEPEGDVTFVSLSEQEITDEE